MKRMWLAVGAVFAAGLVVAYGVGKARANGIPQTNTLAFSGTLMTFGQPDNSAHQMGLTVYLSAGTATTCVVAPANVQVTNGQFSIPLPSNCVTIIHQNPGLEVQVTVDGTAMGMQPITAVPFAVEADTASNVAAGSTLATTLAGFVDLVSNQSIGGTKNFTQDIGLGNTAPGFSIDGSAKTDAFALPAGTTAQRPTPLNGAIRYNNDFGGYELYTNGFWFRQDPMFMSDASRTRVVYGYTGGDQAFSVPSGVTRIFVKMWGAGGGGGSPGGWSYGAAAGGGGHSRGIIPVISGESLRLVVGQGGIVRQGSVGYGYGGGASAAQNTADFEYGGGGGGMTAIFRGSAQLMIAGGGGGGGSSRAWIDNTGGAGGGTTGQRGESPYGGYQFAGNPGTQSGGGAGVPGSGNCATGSTLGLQYEGGHAGCNDYGGGGGSGYFGGSGGGYVESNTMGGGGGGSGYLGSSVVFGVTVAGAGREPGANGDPDLSLTGAGEGSTMNAHGGTMSQAGGDGYMVIYY